MQNVLKLLNKSFGTYNIKGIDVEPTYWMAIAIVFLIFLLLLTVARVRYLYVHWNLSRTSLAFLFYGFLFALILEGFLVIGGRTLFTEILGWENVPKPISTFLDTGRQKLVNVLGITEEVPASFAQETPTYQSVMSNYESLSIEDQESIRDFICK